MKIKILTISAIVLLSGNLVLFSLVARNSMEAKSDQREVSNLSNAIKAYLTEHRKLPIANGSTSHDTDLESDTSFMKHLFDNRAGKSEPHQSPRGISFYSGKSAKYDPVNQRWKGGIKSVETGECDLFDSRGKRFRIRLDTSGDETVVSPIDNESLPKRIIVWSAGKDGDFETWHDNAKSW